MEKASRLIIVQEILRRKMCELADLSHDFLASRNRVQTCDGQLTPTITPGILNFKNCP